MSDRISSLKPFLNLMECRKLKDVKKLAKSLILSKDGFYKLIMIAKMEQFDKFEYAHQSFHREHQPEHLALTAKDLKGIAENSVGEIQGDAIKAFSKINQMYKERKSVVGHMFYTPDFKYWHFFYFDLEDTASVNNHWTHADSPHIHYICDLNPQYTAESAWGKFINGSKSFGGNVHIRYSK